MKKLIIFYAFFCFISVPLAFAKKTDKASPASQSIIFSLGRAFSAGTDKNSTPVSGLYTFDKDRFGLLVGLQRTNSIFDLTVGGSVWPFLFHPLDITLKFGFSGLYHYQYYADISGEHDFLGGLAISFATKKGFNVKVNTSYMEKISTVYALQDYVPYFHDHSFAFSFLIDKTWCSCFEIYEMIGSHDLYRYPLFCSPSFITGICWNTKKNLRFALEGEVRFSDYFTVAVNIDRLVFNGTVRYKF